MKSIYISIIIILLSSFVYGGNITKTPGSTTDVFTELSINGINNPDTLFIDGGTGDIYLKAGASDDGSPYLWDIGGSALNTYQITFSYSNATVTLADGSKGNFISVSRASTETQYLWVVYRNLPLKPSTPSGSIEVCANTNSNYSSTGTNATSYLWTISPSEAGTLTNETTNTVTVDWNDTWNGTAILNVKGINGSNTSPISDNLEVNVKSVPEQPVITGSNTVEKNTTMLFTPISNYATTYEWILEPSIVTVNTINNQASINFTEEETFYLRTTSSNECGNSSISDQFTINVYDITGMQASIDQLKLDTADLNDQIRLLDIQVSDLNTEKQTLLSENDNLKISNSDLQSQVDELTLSKTELQTQVDDLLYANDTLTEDILSLESAKSDLEIQIVELNTITANLQTQVDNLTIQADNLSLQITDLKAENATLTEDNTNLSTTNETLSYQVDTLTNKYNEFKTQIEALQTENSQFETEITSLTSQNESLSLEVTTLNATITSLEALNSDLLATNNSLNSELKRLKGLVADLEDQVTILSKVYILSWTVEEVTTEVFETEIGTFSISLYPNPSPGEIFIECTEIIEEFKLFNLSGALVKQFDVNSLNTSIVIERDNLPPGTYFIHLRTAKGNSVHKIIFE